MTAPPAYASTADIPVPERLLDQVIGQEHAAGVIELAARQRRAVLLVGAPGTGKSMLAAAMAELMPVHGLEDVVVAANPAQPMLPRIVRTPAGEGARQVVQSQDRARRERQGLSYLIGVATACALLIGLLLAVIVSPYALLGAAAAVTILVLLRRRLLAARVAVGERVLIDRGGQTRAPFVDATGAQAGGLLGDVRHDPFQSGGFETEPHELVAPGAVHRAHGGVLFVDEITSLGLESQQRLLTALQERELAITGRHGGSSGAMVLTEPVPCDTVLVVACNPEELDYLHPALRSRLRGFGFELLTADATPRTPESEAALARFVAQEVRRDGRIPHFSPEAVGAVIAEAGRRAGPGRLTLRLRELGGLVRAAGDLAAVEGAALVAPAHVVAAGDLALSIEEQLERSRPDGPVELGALRALPPAPDPAPPRDPGRILVGVFNRHPRDIDLGDARLREVLNLAVDRDRLIREGFGGHADPLPALIPPGAPGAGSGPVPRRHDPARARDLLHDLGWIHGRSLRLAGTPATALQARLVADDLQMALGIHVELQTVDVLAPVWGRRVPGWDVLLQDLPRPEPDAAPAVLHRELLGADGTLRAGPELPHVDRLLAELDATEDRVAADAVAARIDRYCFDASLALFLCAPRAQPAARDLRRQEA